MDMVMNYVTMGSDFMGFTVAAFAFIGGLGAAMQLEMKWGFPVALIAFVYICLRLYAVAMAQ